MAPAKVLVDCSVCMDDNVEIVFMCRTKRCPYQMCKDCVGLALKDSTGENCQFCPMCNEPTARDMVESMCGGSALSVVERELYGKIEYEVRNEKLAKQEGKKVMKGYEDAAQKHFLVLSERLNLSCPRCKRVFYDYDGCNALRCGNNDCRAAFCGICLKDCGTDAHAHARSHGNLFDKNLFLDAKRKREQDTVRDFIDEIADSEPFEVRELIACKTEKVMEGVPSQGGRGMSSFVNKAKASLRNAVRMDRLSVLGEIGDYRITPENISPRNKIPDDYKLSLKPSRGNKCHVTLKQYVGGRWEPIPLPEDKESKEGRKEDNNEDESRIIDSLTNVRRGLQCCSIAFEGANSLFQTVFAPNEKGEDLGDSEISVKFARIGRDGGLETAREEQTLESLGLANTKILGFNQNLRMLLLEKHVENSEQDDLLFEPLRNYVSGNTKRLLNGKVDVPAPETFNDLNEEQQLVAHPLSVLTAMECAGPPGTGKTKTITELVRSLLHCTDLHVIILSERNGAVDAIAAKMADDCINFSSTGKRSIKNLTLWRMILAFGSSGMGANSRLFSLEQKIEDHPELVELRRIVDKKHRSIAKLKRKMLKSLSEGVEDLDPYLPDGSNAHKRARLIASDSEAELSSPFEIVEYVGDVLDSTRLLLEKNHFSNDQLVDLVVRRSAILGKLIPIADIDSQTNWQRQRIQVQRAIGRIVKFLENWMKIDEFSAENAKKLQHDYKQAEEALAKATTRVSMELQEDSRVVMATIGSSHKIPTPIDDKDNKSGHGIVETLEQLRLDEKLKDTVVVFDEAGCIPAYEFLGLSRLQRNIKAVCCVGDKHQLAPYAPHTAAKKSSRNSFGRRRSFSDETEEVESLLDVSGLSAEPRGGKIRLTKQYRVPKDIANMLNDRIYNGFYNTPRHVKVPSRGFHLLDVDKPYRTERRYENENEANKCFELVEQIFEEQATTSIIVVTPYKKQQRLLQHLFKRNNCKDIPIHTIDQVQGIEADFVLLTLVRKPTRFLNKNRFNVALSRVRKSLFLLTCKQEFREAANDSQWECSLIAKDLLRLSSAMSSKNDDSSSSSEYYDSF